jgi:beta-N-acetylhexosaminidase
VAALAAAYVRGLQAGGVAATAKHFPGLGGVAADPHHRAPVVDRLLPGALEPFRAVVDAGVACVMVASHTVRELDHRPALASPRILALLRTDLGFDGVADSENQSIPAVCEPLGGIESAAVAAVAAGVDMLMLDSEISRGQAPPGARAAGVRRRTRVVAALADAVDSGQLDRWRVAQAADRVRALHRTFGLDPSAAAPGWDQANADAGRAADRIAAASVTTVRGGAALPLTIADGRFLAVVRVPDSGQRKADSARHCPDAFPAALRAGHRLTVAVAAGSPVPDGTGAVVVYGYDTRGAAAAEAARWAGHGLPVAQVAFGDPDELAGSPAQVLLAAYSPHRASVDAVAAVLTGQGRPGGTLPVRGASW